MRGEPGTGTGPPFLVPNGEVRKVYPILGNKLLHRNFAALGCNEHDILKFANKYGLLGRPLFLCPLGGGAVVFGESLPVWEDRIKTFGRLLAIWDLVRAKQAGKLGQIVIWPRLNQVLVSAYWVRKGGDYTFYPGSKYRDFEAFRSSLAPHNVECGFESQMLANKNPELLQRWRQGDVIEPALYYVCSEVNKNLDSQFSFKILPFVHKEIYTQPKTLEGAMWLMFAKEVNGSQTVSRSMLQTRRPVGFLPFGMSRDLM